MSYHLGQGVEMVFFFVQCLAGRCLGVLWGGSGISLFGANGGYIYGCDVLKEYLNI